MSKRAREFIIRFSGMCLTLFAVVTIVDIGEVASSFKKISPWVIVAVFFLGLSRVLMGSLRWRTLNPDVNSKLTLWDYFRYSMIGGVFNLFMPGAVGGDLVLFAELSREGLQQKRECAVDLAAAGGPLCKYECILRSG